MRKSLVLPIAAAVAFFAIESSAYAASRGGGVVVRDHRTPPVVRDHRAAPVVRDHRIPPVVRDHRADPAPRGGVVVRDHRAAPVVRDHRTPPVVRDHRAHPAPKKVIRAGRNYDKVPNRVQVVVNGKRVPRYR
jgi:hypothetical protein